MSNVGEESRAFVGRRILLGVTGSIAAYKAVELLRRLREGGAVVRVVMTDHATHFVAPLTFETLSNAPVLIDEFAAPVSGSIRHIEITDELDAAIVAPATANCIAKVAAGIADDALTSAILALGCPLLVAPAMNTRMYRNPSVQRNLEVLKQRGVRIVEPGTGSLACGTSGPGRLADTEQILKDVELALLPKDLADRTVLITAGPTQERLDPVRFISNPSSGKMGYAVAAAARERGAHVILVSGPVQITPPAGVEVVRVTSAAEMRASVFAHYEKSDIVVMAAAVSDFRPVHAESRKMKKEQAATTLELERTEDILAELGKNKGRRILIGFAAETDNLELNALAKLRAKNLDMIVANDIGQEGTGFGSDENAVVCFERSGEKKNYSRMPKTELARLLVDSFSALLKRTAA